MASCNIFIAVHSFMFVAGTARKNAAAKPPSRRVPHRLKTAHHGSAALAQDRAQDATSEGAAAAGGPEGRARHGGRTRGRCGTRWRHRFDTRCTTGSHSPGDGSQVVSPHLLLSGRRFSSVACLR